MMALGRLRVVLGKDSAAEYLQGQDRVDFERRRLASRALLFAAPLLLWIYGGASALPQMVLTTAALTIALVVAWLLAYRLPSVLLRTQLGLRLLDVGMVYLALHSIHLLTPIQETFNGFYVLPVLAAAGTHGRRGAALISLASFVAILTDAYQLSQLGLLHFGLDELAIAIGWSLLFVTVAFTLSFLMRTSGAAASETEAHLNAELEQRNRELESFSYSVSHDLRAPLRSIDGFSRIVLERYREKLDGQAQDYLLRVRNASTRMSELIDALLTLSRVTRADLQLQPVDLSGLAQEIVDMLRRGDPGRAVDVRIEPGVQVRGDPRLLRVALENLLGNAWKFTAERDAAAIAFGRVSANGRRDACCVSDNGAGFDMTYYDKLFSPFQRLHSTREFEGTGIGLATVMRIIERHGGEIWAESAVDEGAKFYFTLPAVRRRRP